MTRFKLFLVGIGAAWAATGALQACGGDSTQTDAGGNDASTDVPIKKDVQTTDVVDDIPVVHPAGTQLAASDGVQIFGVTADDDVIYADGSQSNAIFAVPSAGGTPVKIGTPSGFAVGLHNKTVFVWSSLTTKSVGTLAVWEHGGTLTQIATNSAPNGGFAATTDGKHILYVGNSDTNGAVGDIVGANIDGTNKVSLVTGVDVSSGNNCTPRIGFVTITNAITSTCTVTPGDGGTPSATVTAYAIGAGGDGGTTWTPSSLATTALDFWSTNSAGTSVMVATPAGVQVCTLAGVCVPGESKNIENNQWTFGYMNQAGTSIYYTTSAGDLRTATTAAPAVGLPVQASNVNFVRAISGDDKYILYTKTFDTQQFGGDLYLTSTAANAAAPTALVSTPNGALFGVSAADDFTADFSRVVWIQNLNTSLGLGDLYAVPVAGGTPAKFATNEWQNVTATGTKIVFNDNCNGCSGTGGTGNAYADIKVVDVGTTNAATLLQAGADVPLTAGANSLYLSKDKTKVVYVYSQNAQSTGTPANGGNGLYAVAIP